MGDWRNRALSYEPPTDSLRQLASTTPARPRNLEDDAVTSDAALADGEPTLAERDAASRSAMKLIARAVMWAYRNQADRRYWCQGTSLQSAGALNVRWASA